jgi:hypothetical protein
MTLADSIAVEYRALTVADRVTKHDARRHFEAGGAVVVSEHGHELTHSIYVDTTFHSRETTSWEHLAELVREWRGRYPYQRFYVLRPVDEAAVSIEIAKLLRELSVHLSNDLMDENVVTTEHSSHVVFARKLSVLLACTIAVRQSASPVGLIA